MSNISKIHWTDATWNPCSGCTKKAGRLLDGRQWDEMPQ